MTNAPRRGLAIAGLIIGGLVFLPLGAHLTVESAIDVAKQWRVSEEIIGLTVVAPGTSLPELATGVMAARNRSGSVAMGSIIGSNLFNIAAIMGVTATVATIKAGSHIVAFYMWVMLATTLVFGIITVGGVTIDRKAGIMLTVLYICYIAATVII